MAAGVWAYGRCTRQPPQTNQKEKPMGMSTHIIGIKPPDDHWKRMKAAWDACVEAGIEPPKSVIDFFGDDEPDEKGVVVELEETDSYGNYLDSSIAKPWRNEYSSEGFEVDIRHLPKDVKIIRFYNSW